MLVDDQALIRAGIKSLLGLAEQVQVVAEAENGKQALALLSEHDIDVILLDLSMPVMSGIEMLAALKEKGISTPVLILTTFDDDELILKGLTLGASGYLLKDVSLEALIEAIESVSKGERLFRPMLNNRVIEHIKDNEPQFQSYDQMDVLSKKEHEVLSLMARGCTNKEIASILCKSEGTIKNHVSNVLAKFGVSDRTRAVLKAIEQQII